MAWTQTELDKLKKAYALGALTVEYAGQRVTYRSLAEMKQIIADMESEISGSSSKPRTSVVQFDRS